MTYSFFVVDTNVLKVAEERPGPARTWLLEFAADDQATLIVDFESSPDDKAPYFQRQFLSHIAVGNHRSHILAEYLRNLRLQDPWMRVITDKLRDTRCIIVSVEYSGPHAILPSSFRSRVDPSDRKFIMAAIGYIRHHVMGPRFRPTIVYAADFADWSACRSELEERDFINLKQL